MVTGVDITGVGATTGAFVCVGCSTIGFSTAACAIGGCATVGKLLTIGPGAGSAFNRGAAEETPVGTGVGTTVGVGGVGTATAGT